MHEADYSFFDESYGTTSGEGEKGTDLAKLLKDIRFSTKAEMGLEFVDILTNAVRRTLQGKLQERGWQNIPKIMIHRNEDRYIQFVIFGDGEDEIRNAAYGKIVNTGFANSGKLMLTPSNLLKAEESQ